MNTRTSYMLTAVLSVLIGGSGAMAAASPAFAQLDQGNVMEDTAQRLLSDVPVSVWTDAEVYDHSSIIMVTGAVANMKPGYPITIKVISPTNNIVTIDQIEVNSDGTYSTTLNTAGALWKYDGTYTIRVQYGSEETNNKALVQLKDGIPPVISQRPIEPTRSCTSSELSFDNYCIPFSITGGTVTSTELNPGTSMVVRISSVEPGVLILNPAPSMFNGLIATLVDGEEWDDVQVDGNQIRIEFPAGTQEIEIFGTFVIPEFGAIAALILAVAIISIIAVSARSRLSIMPKY